MAVHNGKPLVPDGENRYHAILGNRGPAYFVNPSSLAPALIAMDATVTIRSGSAPRSVKAEDFFVTPAGGTQRENVLGAGEILAEVHVPAVSETTATYEVRQKLQLDWPLATASVVLDIAAGRVRSARVVLGHVAPVPWRSREAEAALAGKSVTEGTALAAGEAAVRATTPLSRNSYKVQLAKVAVKRAVLAAGSSLTALGYPGAGLVLTCGQVVQMN